MTVQLPDFRLEVYLGEWEFEARHHLTASDAETLTIGELLTQAGEEDRDAFSRLGLGYAPTWGGEALREAIAIGPSVPCSARQRPAPIACCSPPTIHGVKIRT